MRRTATVVAVAVALGGMLAAVPPASAHTPTKAQAAEATLEWAGRQCNRFFAGCVDWAATSCFRFPGSHQTACKAHVLGRHNGKFDCHAIAWWKLRPGGGLRLSDVSGGWRCSSGWGPPHDG